ncbi:MAG: hypothetical protein KAT04_03775, partial [Methylococcales bacterium]|nr:hypothetical protein [Methylococcales bacterium]
ATLCRQTIISAQGDCANSLNQLTLVGSFSVKTDADYEYHSYSIDNRLLINGSNIKLFQEIGKTTISHYQLQTLSGSEYEIRAVSDNAEVSLSALSSSNVKIADSVNNATEQTLLFTATSSRTNIEFSYTGNGSGTTFQIFSKASAAVSEGSSLTPLLLNTDKVFFNKPGQVDDTSSYYEIKVSQGYTYKITIDHEIDFDLTPTLSYTTDLNNAYTTTNCITKNQDHICVVDSNTTSIFIKVDGPANSFSKYKITAEYNPVRDPNDFNNSFTVALSDVVNLKGQVSYDKSTSINGWGSGASSYWVTGIETNTFYKVKLSNLEDGTRIWFNSQSEQIDFNYVCNAVGTASMPDIYCIIKTKSFAQGLPFYIENSFASLGTIGSTYTLNIEKVSEADLYYFSTFKNSSTVGEGCFYRCELLGYSMYLNDSATPFAASITSEDPFHTKLLHLTSGEKIHIQINDYNNGDAYSISIRNSVYNNNLIYQNISFGLPDDPDSFEQNNNYDNTKANATVLFDGDVSDHSLSNNNQNFGDIDWFTFTAP